MSDGGHVWWEDAIVYEVYPRSFADADGDGVGDLPGLRSRLGYLADLGVDAIWLTPFYPSPLADGGYDVSDYCAVDPLLGTMADFDALVSGAAAHQIRVIIDLVPNHCSSAHPLFRAALAAAPGSDERARFIFRDGRGPGGEQPPNNWPSQFGGSAWTRVTEADGHHQGSGQWYLHLYDTSQPDWNWHHPDVPAMFEDVIRFWLDRGVAGLRVDVAHGIVKDPGLPDLTGPQPLNAPSAYRHRPELQPLFRSWRAILDSYPAEGFPGPRTAVGEVWYDVPETLAPYLQSGGLPQVFNFQLILAGWRAAEFRTAIDSALAVTGGSRAPWVIGNHDVARPASRYRLDEGFTPQTVSRLIALGDRSAEAGARRARAAALVLLALPGSAYIYQGEELGLPEVTDIGDGARRDPRFFRTKGEFPGRDGCRVPLPWSAAGTGFGFSRTGQGSSPAEPWLPQPSDWGRSSVESQLADEHSTVNLYRSALRLRRDHPALGRAPRSRTPRARTPWAGTHLAGSARTSAGCSASPGSPGSSSPPTSARRRCRCPPTAMCCSPAGPWPTAACRPTPPSGSARDAGRLRPAFSLYPANRTILEVMPKVRVPRKNVTPGEIVTVLSRRLGPGYQVESNGGRRVMVRKSPLMYASISISDQPGASVFGVHGGGFFFLRLVNTFGTARRVADVLRRSPEFRSL